MTVWRFVSVLRLTVWLIITLVCCAHSLNRAQDDQGDRIGQRHWTRPGTPEKILYTGSKHRRPGYTSGSCHLDTASWAVKLTGESYWSTLLFHRSLDEKADVVAREARLINRGPVGHLSGVYLFVHPRDKDFMAICPDHLDPSRTLIESSLSAQLFPTEDKPVSFTAAADNRTIHIPKDSQPTHNESQDLINGEVNDVTKEEEQKLHLADIIKNTEDKLDTIASVEWYTRQTVRRRSKRSLQFNDPEFDLQWHLVNIAETRMDINVSGVWERGVTGQNVVVVVVDDGLEWTVPDIHVNYNSQGSWDLNSNDANPLPDISKKNNHHGTRCAGEIAAAANNHYCGVGVAYEAGIAGIRVLDGPMTDSLEATAFTKNFDINDIYSCSWGPDDDGKTVDGPHHLANLALRHGVAFGRQGYGSIYVVASGNGGSASDNCNYDGYANSIFTITIGAVDESGQMPYYAEECASMLAVTFSSGSSVMRSIVTTDWLHHGGIGCTTQHTGTSAAAPLAAGMIALMLSARPCLTWRDIQHIIVITAVKVDIDIAQWQRNAAGLHHSHQHGFGLMDAWRLVNAAKVWEPVPWMTVFTSQLQTVNDPIRGGDTLSYSYEVTPEELDGYNLHSLEYVQVTVTINHNHRGDLKVELYCPSNTYSILGAYRPKDDSADGFDGWTFSTVRCWGEKPQGIYQIKIFDKGDDQTNRGLFISWKLKLFGSALSFEDVQERMNRVKESYSGQYLNDSYQATCPPPPENLQVVLPLSERLLKILVLTGAFATFMAVYESFEYIFCYDNEKKEHSRLMSLYRQAQGLSANRAPPSEDETSSERQTLLHSAVSHDRGGETIALEDISTSANYSHDVQTSVPLSTDDGACLDERMFLLSDQAVPSTLSSHAQSADLKNNFRCPKELAKKKITLNCAEVASSEHHGKPGYNEVEYDEFIGSDDCHQTN